MTRDMQQKEEKVGEGLLERWRTQYWFWLFWLFCLVVGKVFEMGKLLEDDGGVSSRVGMTSNVITQLTLLERKEVGEIFTFVPERSAKREQINLHRCLVYSMVSDPLLLPNLTRTYKFRTFSLQRHSSTLHTDHIVYYNYKNSHSI